MHLKSVTSVTGTCFHHQVVFGALKLMYDWRKQTHRNAEMHKARPCRHQLMSTSACENNRRVTVDALHEHRLQKQLVAPPLANLVAGILRQEQFQVCVFASKPLLVTFHVLQRMGVTSACSELNHDACLCPTNRQSSYLLTVGLKRISALKAANDPCVPIQSHPQTLMLLLQ